MGNSGSSDGMTACYLQEPRVECVGGWRVNDSPMVFVRYNYRFTGRKRRNYTFHW